MHGDTAKFSLGIGFLIMAVSFLTPFIDTYQNNFLAGKGVFEKDPLYRVLGETRKIVSNYSYIKGDEYLHGGVTAEDARMCEALEHKVQEQRDPSHGADNTYPRKAEEDVTGISKLNVLPYLGSIIHISKHIHLQGEEEKELLPWFYYAVRLNPENIDAYVIGGYWIGVRLDRPDEAIRFLEEGLMHNPNSWQIYTQLGEIYFLNKKDYRQALASLQKAYNTLTDENSDT
jgi:tetratricopeptide (TPR) repeat protein